MNTDIRISVGFWQHPKTKKTIRRLGLEGVMALQVLWIWAAQNRPDGNLRGMDGEDVELAAGWEGEEGSFFATCLGLWIDEDAEGLRLHDWEEHNPWVSGSEARRVAASVAGKASAEARRQRKLNRTETNRNEALDDVDARSNGALDCVEKAWNGSSTPLPSPKKLRSKNTTPQGSTVNEGRARARVDVPEGGDGLCPEHHEAEEWAGGRVLPEAPDVLEGTLDASMEFLELRELYDRLARCEAPLAGHDAYKMLRAGRMWPGLARITQAIEEWGETPRWKRGYAPGLKRFLAERWWLKSPDVDDVQGAASDAGREPDTYSRLLEEARKQKEVRA